MLSHFTSLVNVNVTYVHATTANRHNRQLRNM